MQKFRLITAVGCILAAALLAVLTYTGLWQQWGFSLAACYLTLGIIGLLYLASAFIPWLVNEQKHGKNYWDQDDPDHNKENHDGV